MLRFVKNVENKGVERRIMKYFSRFYILAIVVFFLNIGVILFHYSQKSLFHIDEIFSYAHANSTTVAFLDPSIDSSFKHLEVLQHRWLDYTLFQHWLTVQAGEETSYAHIWRNMAKDVHPPLYFVLLHAICSFFPDVFSKWLGGSLNLLAFVLTFWLLYKLAILLLRDEKVALAVSVLWGYSSVGIASVLYLRMYALQTLFAVGLCYEMAKVIKENSADGKRLLAIFLYSAMGILTQYNSLILSFAVAIGSGAIFLFRRNYMLLWRLGMSLACSVAVLFVIFPPAYDVLLNSSRGKEVIGALVAYKDNPFMIIDIISLYRRLLKVCFSDLFSFRQWEMGALVMCAALGVMWCRRCSIRQNVVVIWLFGVCLMVGSYIDFCMPQMGKFDSRYFMFLMPQVTCLFVYLILQVGGCLKFEKKWVVVFIFLCVLVNSLCVDFSNRSAYAMRADANERKFLSDVLSRKTIFLGMHEITFFEHAFYLRHQGGRVYWAGACDVELMKKLRKNSQALYVMYKGAGRLSEQIPQRICPEIEDIAVFLYRVYLGQSSYDVYALNGEKLSLE